MGNTALMAELFAVVPDVSYNPLWFECRPETTFDVVTSRLSLLARQSEDDELADVIDEVSGDFRDRAVRIASALATRRYIVFLDDFHSVSDAHLTDLISAVAQRSVYSKFVIASRSRPAFIADIGTARVQDVTLTRGLDETASADFFRDNGMSPDGAAFLAAWEATGRGHPKALQLLTARARSIPLRVLLRDLSVFNTEAVGRWLAPLLAELDQASRKLVDDLAIFDRPVAVERLHQVLPMPHIEACLAPLIDRFIVTSVSDSEIVLHPLVRDYSFGLIENKKERHVWAARFYLGHRSVPLDPAVLTDEEIGDTIAAWDHFVQAGERVRASELIDELATPLMNRGELDQVILLLDRTWPSSENPPARFNSFVQESLTSGAT